MPEFINYFAYGSNLHPLRLSQRVPSSRALGPASLSGHQLHFHKKGQDGSGKCNVFYTGQPQHQVIGVVYEMRSSERRLLDAAENLGCGYELAYHDLQLETGRRRVFLYVALPEFIDDSLSPYHWYKNLVLEGARLHGLPDDYSKAVAEVVSCDDPDSQRDELHQQILRSEYR